MAKINIRICAWCGKSEGVGKPAVIPATIVWLDAMRYGVALKEPTSRYFHPRCIGRVQQQIRRSHDILDP